MGRIQRSLRLTLGLGAAVSLGAVAFLACSDSSTPAEVTPSTTDGGSKTGVDGGGGPIGNTKVDSGLDEREWVQARKQSPLPPVPPNPTNKWADDPKAARLGQMFFFEKSYAGPIEAPVDGGVNNLGNVGEAGKVSCASCHDKPWGSDIRTPPPNNVSLGTNWTDRNSPPVVNSTFYDWIYWDGRVDTLWMQAALAGENKAQQNSDRMRIAHMIFKKYRAEYEEVFGAIPTDIATRLALPATDPGAFPVSAKPKASASAADGPWETKLSSTEQKEITRMLVNFAKAIEAYERLLVSRNSPWDRFVAGDLNAISPSAKNGYKLFIGKAYCNNCHRGPLFSDNEPHNIGVPHVGPHLDPNKVDEGRSATIDRAVASPFRGDGPWSDDPDAGAAKIAKVPDFVKLEDGGADAGMVLPDGGGPRKKGMWRTKHLRQIAETAPYMHNGSLATLEDVMALYNAGGGDAGLGELDPAFKNHIRLTDQEVRDLIEFMKTLTGDLPDTKLWQDTSKP